MTKSWTILTGDNRQTLKTIADDSVDAIVTDPPYGIDFLGKAWDANTGALETYQECLRVLKPGGHILAFSAARTYHHLAVTLEQAGFEIRDQIMWIYSSGFPKSQDVGRSIQRSLGVKDHYTIDEWEQKQGYNVNRPGDTMGFGDPDKLDGHKDSGLSGKVVKVTDPEAQQWAGWGTALKPAHEPICLARKPMRLSIAKNCQEWGVGALNIDACRVPYVDMQDMESAKGFGHYEKLNRQGGPSFRDDKPRAGKRTVSFHHATGGGETQSGGDGSPQFVANEQGRFPSNVIGEIPLHQKYFYCPKVSRKERSIGCEDLPQQHIPTTTGSQGGPNGTWYCGDCGKQIVKHVNHSKCDNNKQKVWRSSKPQGNNHPTVKPVALMRYLIQLITPAGGTVLDPFAGSGSTGMAAVELGHTFVGCELDPNYVAIANQRIQAWLDQVLDPQFRRLFEMADD